MKIIPLKFVVPDDFEAADIAIWINSMVYEEEMKFNMRGHAMGGVEYVKDSPTDFFILKTEIIND